MRRRLKSLSSPATSNARSMFAAITWASSARTPRRDASVAMRLNEVRRGTTAAITPDPSMATQSPTVGKSAGPSAA